VSFYAFRLLDKLGVEKVTIIDGKGLRVSGYTVQMWEYLIIKGKREYDIVGEDFAPGMTVIDIGANQGFFTIHAASKGARVIAVEPSRTNLGLLKENVEQNNLADNVVCVNCAVSDKVGTATMFEPFNDRGRYLTTFVSIVERDPATPACARAKSRSLPWTSYSPRTRSRFATCSRWIAKARNTRSCPRRPQKRFPASRTFHLNSTTGASTNSNRGSITPDLRS
jgi:Met-10+ like-protein